MLKKIIRYLNLRDIGGLEMLIAIYPILAGYSYGIVNCNMLFIIIAALTAILTKQKHSRNIKCSWLVYLIIFVAIHEVLLMTVIPVKGYFINNTISVLLICACIIPIVKAINYEKLVGCLNWVSIFTIIGLLYQVSIVFAGGTVSPIKLPFMPDMGADTRLHEVVIRPSSFFWEPAAMVTFLMIPMFISLVQKKFLWTGIIMIAMFLSTSSTGILMSFVMLSVYVLTQKINFTTRVFVVILGLGLVYFLLNSSYFESGLNKIANTDPEKNARLMNGVFLFDSMSVSDKLWGIEAANIDEYYEKSGGTYYGVGSVFVPAFWLSWAKYGIFGLIIFLGMYISFVKKNKTLLPYIAVIFISMFFQSISIGSSGFAYQLIFLYAYVNQCKAININTVASLKRAIKQV